MMPRDLARLRAADRTRLRTAALKLEPLAREAVTAAACSADSARMATAERLGIVDYDCDTSTTDDSIAVWSNDRVRHASRIIYEALREAHELIAHANNLIASEDPEG